MCEKCVREEFPERDSLCTDQGSYMINFLQCNKCGGRDIKSMNKDINETELEELVTFEHTCANCQHVCAEHEYKFWVVDNYQYYEMSCLLCGNGEDKRSVLPVDPNGGQTDFF